MVTVGLKILKNKLSEYVRLAAAGETIVITDRGRAVAEIIPPQPKTTKESFIKRGVREGWQTPAKNRDGLPQRLKSVHGMSFEQLMYNLEHHRKNLRFISTVRCLTLNRCWK